MWIWHGAIKPIYKISERSRNLISYTSALCAPSLTQQITEHSNPTKHVFTFSTPPLT